MNVLINRLINYAILHGMIKEEDVDYSVNLLLDLFRLDSFQKVEIHESLSYADSILEKMLDYAVTQGFIEDNVTQRDLFDTRIMNCVMPRPSEVVHQFYDLYQMNPLQATDYFYQLSIHSQYIRKLRTDKNIRFKKYYKYGNIEITINLSKPEKDPKEIALLKSVAQTNYPKCLLCKENVGFAGHLSRPARQTHRIIPLYLNDSKYYLQYSPYVYYNEHCIVFNELHQPMIISRETFQHLLSFIEQFPHYMLGSNADLPIVGGSILTHDHYQGGCYTFPIESAETIKKIILSCYPNVQIEILKWPLSTIRATSTSQQALIDFADDVLKKWRNYSEPSLDIIAYSGDTPHNTITPIARKKKEYYQMDLVLRNNRTSEQYPDGIFHPHASLHHIKKENIGLIEVMGLAILPGRLKNELMLLKDCLLNKKKIEDYKELQKHCQWYEEMRQKYVIKEDNVDEILANELTRIFVCVLEDAGVFKMDDQGIDSFISFVESMDKEE